MSTSMTALCCLFRSISSGLEFHLSLCSELPLQTSLLAHHHCHQKQTQAQTHLSSCKSSYIYNVSPLSPLICNVHGIYRPACTISDCRIVKFSFTRLLICCTHLHCLLHLNSLLNKYLITSTKAVSLHFRHF